MQIKVALFALIILTACGKDVSIPKNSLQRQSSITDADTESVFKDAVLIRSKVNKVKLESKTYTISHFSSNLALTFISELPDDSETPVKFRGETKGVEVVIEKIEKTTP